MWIWGHTVQPIAVSMFVKSPPGDFKVQPRLGALSDMRQAWGSSVVWWVRTQLCREPRRLGPDPGSVPYWLYSLGKWLRVFVPQSLGHQVMANPPQRVVTRVS